MDEASAAAGSVIRIASRANDFLKLLRRLSQDSTAYRKEERVWLEGDHLCRAALSRGWKPEVAVFSERVFGKHPELQAGKRTVVVADGLWADLSGLESPFGMGFLMALPAPQAVAGDVATVILDRVQDAGNVGSILRSAAAFGFSQVLALKGTAALWSPKVLRAGMGAHFGLKLIESLEIEALELLTIPLAVTSSHQGGFLHEIALPDPCAWVMGNEGQGVGEALMAKAAFFARIAQPGGEESLNVAAAAAVCLHASAAAGLRGAR
ncbi:MAG: RNA methyltransferase [Pseudomonadota bacterium]